MALRVLLADESTTIKKVMQLALQDFAVEVKAVHAGVDVIEVAKSFQPDIVFADVLLQKKNGYEVCAEIKRDPHLGSLPVVLMWSSFLEIDERLAHHCGADERLEKPFDVETLRQLILRLVPATQSQRLAHFLDFSESVAQPLKQEVEQASSQARVSAQLERRPRQPSSQSGANSGANIGAPPGPPPTRSGSTSPLPPARVNSTSAQQPSGQKVGTAVPAAAPPAQTRATVAKSAQAQAPTPIPISKARSGSDKGSSGWNMDSFDDIGQFADEPPGDDPYDVSENADSNRDSSAHRASPQASRQTSQQTSQQPPPHALRQSSAPSSQFAPITQPSDPDEADFNPVELSDFSLDDEDADEGFSEFKLSDLSKSHANLPSRKPAQPSMQQPAQSRARQASGEVPDLTTGESDEASSYHDRHASPPTAPRASRQETPPGTQDSETWSHQDLSAFRIDLQPVPVDGEDFALTFDVNEPNVEGTGYTRLPDLNIPGEHDADPYAPSSPAMNDHDDSSGTNSSFDEDVELSLELDESAMTDGHYEIQALDDHYQAPQQPMPAEFEAKLAPDAFANTQGNPRSATRTGATGAHRLNPGAHSGTNPGPNSGANPGANPGANSGPNFGTIPQMSEERLEQIIRAQSQEVIEALVRRLVPDIATKIIQRELARLLDDSPRPE